MNPIIRRIFKLVFLIIVICFVPYLVGHIQFAKIDYNSLQFFDFYGLGIGLILATFFSIILIVGMFTILFRFGKSIIDWIRYGYWDNPFN